MRGRMHVRACADPEGDRGHAQRLVTTDYYPQLVAKVF